MLSRKLRGDKVSMSGQEARTKRVTKEARALGG
jgi:hypothetical protein